MEAEEEREVENFLRPIFEPDPEGRRRSTRLGLCEGVWRVCEGVWRVCEDVWRVCEGVWRACEDV